MIRLTLALAEDLEQVAWEVGTDHPSYGLTPKKQGHGISRALGGEFNHQSLSNDVTKAEGQGDSQEANYRIGELADPEASHTHPAEPAQDPKTKNVALSPGSKDLIGVDDNSEERLENPW